MDRFLTKKDFRFLVEKREYKSEEELESVVIQKLPRLLNVKPSQVTNQFCTTGFDGTLSNCADIVVKSNEDVPHPLIVIELKLDKNIKQYHGENYTEAEKQLRKYCQDIRASYGIILTDNYCLMYRFDYLAPESTRERIEKIPFPEEIDKEMGLLKLRDTIVHTYGYKYSLTIIFALLYVGFLTGLKVSTSRVQTINNITPSIKTITSNIPKNIRAPVSKDRVVISFSTERPSYSSILLFKEGQNTFMEVGDTTPSTTIHSMVLKNLSPNTQYYYKIIIGSEVFDNKGQLYTFITSGT